MNQAIGTATHAFFDVHSSLDLSPLNYNDLWVTGYDEPML